MNEKHHNESVQINKGLLFDLISALEFYANPETYFAIGFFPDSPCGDFIDDFSVTELGRKPGYKARDVLDKVENHFSGRGL